MIEPRSTVIVVLELGSGHGREEQIKLPQATVPRPVKDVADVDAAKSKTLQIGAELRESQALLCDIEVITLYYKERTL